MREHAWLEALLPDRVDALLIAGGALPNRRLLRAIARTATELIAIDGGTRHLKSLRLIPHIVIGDLDSVAPQDLTWARRERARVVFMRKQDSSDIEKALAYCRKHKLNNIAIAGIDGDRPDHFLHAISRAPCVRGLRQTYLFANAIGFPLSGRSRCDLDLPQGTILSWIGIPKSESCTLSGVKWPFSRRTLELGAFQSLSNSSVDSTVVFRQQSGKSLIIIPIP